MIELSHRRPTLSSTGRIASRWAAVAAILLAGASLSCTDGTLARDVDDGGGGDAAAGDADTGTSSDAESDTGTDVKPGDGGAACSTPGATESCGTSEGICETGSRTCRTNGVWGPCKNQVSPKKSETCNGKDDDCDGSTDEGVATTYYRDADGDGHGDPAQTKTACSAPSGYVARAGDCDDSNPNVHPGASETCGSGQVDEDCDGTVDEGCSCTSGQTRPCGNSTGQCTKGTQSCSCSGGSCSWGTCTGGVKPSNETCDNKDNDCDGQTDESGGSTYYRDADGDGHGAAGQTKTACSAPQGYVAKKGDCDDGDSDQHPGHAETCDNKDNDCDGQTDEGVGTTCYSDGDGDGYGAPGSSVKICNASCSNFGGNLVSRGGDCDDSASYTYPGAAKHEDSSGCYKDQDGDGYGDANPPSGVDAGSDCDDSDPDISPIGVAKCDGKDNDCDGTTDELEGISGSLNMEVKHKAEEDTGWPDHKKRMVSTATDTGFCTAFLDKSGDIQFSHIEPSSGSSPFDVTRHTKSFSGKDPAELFTMAWSGNSCGFIYRRKVNLTANDDVYVARWNPDVPSTYEQKQLTTNTYNSTTLRHSSALEFINGVGWVAAYTVTPVTANDRLEYKTLPDYFYGSTSFQQSGTVTSMSIGIQNPHPSVDISEPLPSHAGDDAWFAVRGNWASGELRIYGVSGGSSSEFGNVAITNASGISFPELQRVRGDLYLAYHDNGSKRKHLREILSSGSSLTYDNTGSVQSASRSKRTPSNRLGGAQYVGKWMLDPHDDKLHQFTETGGLNGGFRFRSPGTVFFSQEPQTLAFDLFGRGAVYQLGLVDRSPYRTRLDYVICD